MKVIKCYALFEEDLFGTLEKKMENVSIITKRYTFYEFRYQTNFAWDILKMFKYKYISICTKPIAIIIN